MDLEITRYETLDDLLVYCNKVASSVGMMISPILAPGRSIKKLEQISYDLGIALQLTNILRDIGEDITKGRIYIPQTLLSKYNITEDDIKNGIINKNFKDMFEEVMSIANSYYEKALTNIDIFEDNAKLAVLYSLFIYREILEECKSANYDVYTKKNFVPLKRKIEIIHDINKKYI